MRRQTVRGFKLTQARQETETAGSEGAWISYDALVKKDRHKFQLDFLLVIFVTTGDGRRI